MNHPKAEPTHQGEHEKNKVECLDLRLEPGQQVAPGAIDVAADARSNVQNEATDRTNHDVQENDQTIDNLLESVSNEHILGEETAIDKMPKYQQLLNHLKQRK